MRAYSWIALPIAAFAVQACAPAETPASATAGGNTCLYVADIERSEVVDNNRAILFHMDNGRVYRANFRTACPGLAGDGFVQRVHNNRICANQEIIYTIRPPQSACALGDFALLN